MFCLTPRAEDKSASDKSASLPSQGQPHENQTSLAGGPSQEEQRLSQALKKVLTKKSTERRHGDEFRNARNGTHTSAQANAAKPTPPTPFMKKNTLRAASTINNVESNRRRTGFFWVSTDPIEDKAQSPSKSSLRWLKKARRENRRAKIRRGTQWFLLICGAGAAIAMTMWPSAS